MRIANLQNMEVNVEVNENDIVNVNLADTSIIEVDAYPNRSFEGVVTEIANSADVTGTGSADQVTNYKVKVRITTPHNLEYSSDLLLSESTQESPSNDDSPTFKPGMSATVDIKTNTVFDVVSVPIQAVTVRNFAEQDSVDTEEPTVRNVSETEDFRRVVFLNDNGIARQVEVETGISNNTYIQIMSGLEAGQEIITGSYRVLSRELEDGDEIEAESNN
jgi:HlyD family secretion protein